MNLKDYSVPFLLSLGLHSFLLIGLFSFDSTPTPKAPSKPAPPPSVQAVAVNPQQIQSQVEEIKAAEQAKAEAARKQQENLKKQADMAEKKRKQEEDRFAKIKAAQKKVEKEQEAKQKAAAAELEKLKKQQVEEKKKLDAKKTKAAKEKALQEKLAAEEKTSKNTKTEKTEQPSDTQLQGEIDKYQGMILQAIAQQWIIPENSNQDASAKLLIRLAPGGMVLDVKLVSSSKDPALDRSAIAAVHKASPLPVPTDADIFDKFREFTLTVQPKDVINR